jgi:hypothetical protein
LPLPTETIELVLSSIFNFKLGQNRLTATFNTTHDGASTCLSSLRNVAGKGPKKESMWSVTAIIDNICFQ